MIASTGMTIFLVTRVLCILVWGGLILLVTILRYDSNHSPLYVERSTKATDGQKCYTRVWYRSLS